IIHALINDASFEIGFDWVRFGFVLAFYWL
ncbi:unnamed protein product, partial [marine sediment metagenome]